MSVETNKQTVQRFIEEVYNQRQLQNLQEFAAPEYTNHDPKGDITQGPQNLAGFHSASPDLHLTITQILGEGDFVAVQWTAVGTHQRPFAHMTSEFAGPAKGRSVSITGMWLFRFEGDTIAELWNHWDRHHLLEQTSADRPA